MSATTIREATIRQGLRHVVDPQLDGDIVDSGLVDNVAIDAE
jgi:metal-sulfur cluster biosynthetic enzyme